MTNTTKLDVNELKFRVASEVKINGEISDDYELVSPIDIKILAFLEDGDNEYRDVEVGRILLMRPIKAADFADIVDCFDSYSGDALNSLCEIKELIDEEDFWALFEFSSCAYIDMFHIEPEYDDIGFGGEILNNLPYIVSGAGFPETTLFSITRDDTEIDHISKLSNVVRAGEKSRCFYLRGV